MNLAIDLFIETEKLQAGLVNRTLSDEIQANGKGVNVSLILKQLGVESTALGFSGGFTGNFIETFLQEKGIATNFVPVEGLTRINVFTKVQETGEEFKQVNQGPLVSKMAQGELLQKISQLQAGDYLIVSGSLPRGVESDLLLQIAAMTDQNKIHLVMDVSDEIVLDCLQYKPFLLKPNEEEISHWFHKPIVSSEEAIDYAKELIRRGAQRVLLSLGSDGAAYIDSSGMVYRSNSPTGKVVNTACAGDTLLGTFLAGLLNEDVVEDTLSKSVAAGSSTAFRSGLTDFSDVSLLQKQIVVIKEDEK